MSLNLAQIIIFTNFGTAIANRPFQSPVYYAYMNKSKEQAIRAIVSCSVSVFAQTFAERHIAEVDNPNGVINMKINNIFIAALGSEIQYYSALARSLDSSLGNMLETMAISIAKLNFSVSRFVEGFIYRKQTDFIAELLEQYKRRYSKPEISDYSNICDFHGDAVQRHHESDYYLTDNETGDRYLIELKIGGDLDNKKARSEKEALLEQYCILSNRLQSCDNIKILFATAYNRFGEGNPWLQNRVRQYFADDELCISSNFWNLICKSDKGFDIVIDEYRKSAPLINEALVHIKQSYLD